MKYHVKTFGCQMNEHDSETLAGLMETIGYQQSNSLEDCDAIIVNTCCIRESAENRILGFVGNLKNLKKEKPSLIIAVGGCMTQQPGAAEKLRKKASHVDIIFGTHNLFRLPYFVTKIQNGSNPIIEIINNNGNIQENLPIKRVDKIKAQVTITYGCNNYCSYCIVPYVRGRERSRDPLDIKNEIEQLAKNNYREIMLLGQNVNSYGLDLKEQLDFADLLSMLDTVNGIERIRYMTSHPRDFNKKLIDTIAKSHKVCEHFHLPIQAGSNKILKKMNRGYTRDTYLKLIENIRNRFSYSSITTDIIVGFPGETSGDFNETMDLIKEVEFDAAYTFLYSSRSGTPAANLPDQVPLDLKKTRLQQLMNEQNSISFNINRKLIGSIEEILVEGISKTKDNMLTGRTRTNKIVNFPGSIDLIGNLVQIKITNAKTWHLEGEII
ncbi:MAG: tRNA (N6-isopentenyl adenosine(37)-C2)-methylthiotransferase MiaB [Bacillota bacterium]|jgi:tRNA-2-methylthio-N6-dimethylallyladenosine synthase